MPAALGAGALVALGYTNYKVYDRYFAVNQINVDEENEKLIEEEKESNDKKGRRRGKDNETKGGPPRDPKTKNYLPDPAAEGTPHSTFGKREGKSGLYTQGATFDEKGNFKRRTDVTDHGRYDHPNPHYHPATSPNSANSPPEAIRFKW